MLWWVLGIVVSVGFIAWIVYELLVNAPLFNDSDLFDDLFDEDEFMKQLGSRNDDE